MKHVTESQFYMWRTLFAIAHADDIVTDEEVRFMTEALEDLPFSEEQQKILKDDISEPKDIVEMFGKISNSSDQAEFFNFARTLVWVDGDYGEEEQEIMLKLKRLHIQNVDVDNLVGNVGLQLDDSDSAHSSAQEAKPRVNNKKSIIYSFRQKFLKERNLD
ncbi:MAG: hypothetical protein ACLFR0_02705 [Alphaproteobacteria bacterium]